MYIGDALSVPFIVSWCNIIIQSLKIEIRPVFPEKMQILKKKKHGCPKLDCHGNINIDVHATTIFKCSQINSTKSRLFGVPSLRLSTNYWRISKKLTVISEKVAQKLLETNKKKN